MGSWQPRPDWTLLNNQRRCSCVCVEWWRLKQGLLWKCSPMFSLKPIVNQESTMAGTKLAEDKTSK